MLDIDISYNETVVLHLADDRDCTLEVKGGIQGEGRRAHRVIEIQAVLPERRQPERGA